MASLIGRRMCAVLTACSALLHVAMLGHAANIVAGALVAVMIVGCLYCALHLWQRGTPGIWCTVALMNLAMIALHTPMPAHHHGAVAPAQSALVSHTMSMTVLVALTEVMIAGTVLFFRTRNRSLTRPPWRHSAIIGIRVESDARPDRRLG